VNLRRPTLFSRCLLLLALLLGLLAPAATLALGHGEPLVGVCRSPDPEAPSGAMPHGWFDHCAACGALGQTLGELPAQATVHVPAVQQIGTAAPEAPDAAHACACTPPPPRGPPAQH
jgi:hypothetical protein